MGLDNEPSLGDLYEKVAKKAGRQKPARPGNAKPPVNEPLIESAPQKIVEAPKSVTDYIGKKAEPVDGGWKFLIERDNNGFIKSIDAIPVKKGNANER